MSGILVQIVLSWLLVWLFQKKDLSVFGLMPTRKRVKNFFLFLFVTSSCCSFGYFLYMAFGARWKINPHTDILTVLDGLWWHLRSVIFEELIFRGALLYILIKRIGPKPSIIISAIGFGVYHWFSFNILGQPLNMLITFISTGVMGLLLAYAYAKTFSLFIPIAIHLGWNGMNMIFANGPIENSVFIPAEPAFKVTVSILIAGIVIYLPVVLAFLINFMLLKRLRQDKEDQNFLFSSSRS